MAKLKFSKIDLASGNPEGMYQFFHDVFSIEFETLIERIGGKEWKMYKGELGGLILFICPAETSNTNAGQEGIHQFHLQVEDLDQLISHIRGLGFAVEDVPFGEGESNYCLKDPDGHPWILSQ